MFPIVKGVMVRVLPFTNKFSKILSFKNGDVPHDECSIFVKGFGSEGWTHSDLY